MTPKQTVRTLTLVAWTLLALAHGKGGLFKKGQKCQVLKPVMEVDWKKMEGVEWMEGLTFPDVWKKCPVLRFYPHNETLFLQTKDGPYSPIKSSDRLKLLFNGTRQYWYKTHPKFQQILDTDYSTWALVHHCWEGGSGSWFMLLLRKPLKAIPETVMARVKSSMAKAGRTKKYWWKRTGCMLPEDVQKLVIVDGLVP
ncbi:uncharacterized protein LOC119444055 isoform X1 [Dermacentor silvarum]|uniref:uncharacterized protein LOC119444055 isoform X1 n=1 Tax=Dermacentor silvarum TaxID=543639 RepID=UPI0021018AEB|nr:uncharacterized protein LOC119444055 isoform X1 [Dermacentor silvarum]